MDDTRIYKGIFKGRTQGRKPVGKLRKSQTDSVDRTTHHCLDLEMGGRGQWIKMIEGGHSQD